MLAPIEADLSGRVCVVTGASSGIGKEAARGLARLGARVVMACRDRERGESALAELRADTGSAELELALVDVSSRRSVREFAKDLQERHPRIHVLVNNAGIWSARRRLSEDGHELVWATNVLGYSQATELLEGALRRAAPSRVVNVASDMAYGLDLEDVEFARRRYDAIGAYAQSKQANRMLTWELARRLEGSEVTANAMHPGGVNTGIFLKGGGLLGAAAAVYGRLRGRSPALGADTVVWLAASADLATVNGRYWKDRRERPCRFRDTDQENRLVDLCRRMTSA